MTRSDKHDDRAVPGDLTEAEFQTLIQSVSETDYYHYVKALEPAVTGKFVRSSEAGSGGLVLYFVDGTWVAVFLAEDVLRYTVGSGELPDAVRQRFSTAAVDGWTPLVDDLPYSEESCDLAAEVARSHGQQIDGLGIGAQSFSFGFPEGYELDMMLFPTADGPVLRVFWERW